MDKWFSPKINNLLPDLKRHTPQFGWIFFGVAVVIMTFCSEIDPLAEFIASGIVAWLAYIGYEESIPGNAGGMLCAVSGWVMAALVMGGAFLLLPNTFWILFTSCLLVAVAIVALIEREKNRRVHYL